MKEIESQHSAVIRRLVMILKGRNHPKGIGIAQRTRKNLEYIKSQVDSGNEEVHLVTQLVNSLLGLIVVPQEKELADRTQQLKLQELEEKGWPEWDITKGKAKTQTLGRLIWRIRNATAHGRFIFSGPSDSPNLWEVILTVEDGPRPEKGKPWKATWRASIGGEALYGFCMLFSAHIEETVE